MQFSRKYESEHMTLKQKISDLQIKLHDMDLRKGRDRFVSIVRKLREMEIITPAILQERIDRIEVYETEGTGKNRTQRIAIYYRFVGCLELPEGTNYATDLHFAVAIEYIAKQPA